MKDPIDPDHKATVQLFTNWQHRIAQVQFMKQVFDVRPHFLLSCYVDWVWWFGGHIRFILTLAGNIAVSRTQVPDQ